MNNFLILIVLILYFLIIIMCSNINFFIKNIDIFYFKKRMYINDINIVISIKLLKIINIPIINMRKDYIKILGFNIAIKKKFKSNFLKWNNLILSNKNKLKILNPQIKLMDLKIGVGSDIMPITIISIPIITSFISYLLNNVFDVLNKNNIRYKIIPRYNTNNFDVILNSIISIDIINLMYFLLLNTKSH